MKFRPQRENKGKRKKGQILERCQRIKKKLWNIKVKVMPIVIGALGRVPKARKNDWKNQKSEEESRQFRPQNF